MWSCRAAGAPPNGSPSAPRQARAGPPPPPPRQVYKVQPIEALVPIGVGRSDTASPVLRWAAAVLGIGLAVAAVVIARTDLGRYSLAAISLSFAAAVALCFAATGPIVRASAVVARWFGAPGALGATTLERAPRRVWATMMTVMIGVAATVAMGGASSNMVASATASFEDLGDTDLYVSPVSMEQFPTGPLLPDGLVDKIAALPEVEQARAGQMAFATLGTGRVMLQGYPSDVVTHVQGSITPASAEQMGTGAGVVLSRDVSRSLGAEVGDELTLPTPTGDHTVRVVQVIPYFSVISGIVVMDISRLHEWYQRPGETIIGIDLKPGVDVEAAKATIRELAGPELSIQTGSAAVDAISASLRQGTSISNAILWIVVLVATVALLNTLMLSVLDRRRELGVLRAMGTGRKFLLRSVLAEAAGIGITGAAIGLVVGVVVQYLSTTAIGHAMTIDIVWEPSPLLLVYGTIALLLALLGSIPPALRAARMPIVEALAVD